MSEIIVTNEGGNVVVAQQPSDVVVVLLPEQGPRGLQGVKGDKGDTGGVGPKGDTGAKGDTGNTGVVGPAAWLTPVAWATGLVCVAVAPATVVTYLGETYVCTTAHTAAATFDAAKFVKVAAKATLDAHTHTLDDITDAGTAAALDYGTGAGDLVRLDVTTGKLPAVDGSLLTGLSAIPVGTTIYVNGTAAPSGFVKENGALLSRVTYAALWTYAQALGRVVTDAAWSAGDYGSFSVGDGATTFRIPDSRGLFVRAWDDSRGVDTSRTLGSYQADENKAHTHTAKGTIDSSGYGFAAGDSTIHEATVTTSSSGGTESRPKNISKLACIKY